MRTIFTYLRGDRVIWVITFFLCMASLLVVYSSTGSLAYKQAGGNMFYYLTRQGIFIVIGLGAAYGVHLIPHGIFYRLSQVFYFLSIPLLLYTLMRGASINEAARWISLPGGLSFQTSDLAKMALIMYLATQLSQRNHDVKDLRKGFIPLMIPIVVTCSLILPANFSTAALLFVISIILLFIGRVRIRHLMTLAGIGLIAISLFVVVAINSPDTGRVGTWKRRIENFISKDGDNFQADQAKIAIATGGILGKGPGQSVQRNVLPHPYSDFIFAIIVEEYGFLVGLIIMGLYLTLLFRSVALIRKCKRTFSAFLVAGMVLLIVIQAFAHIGVCVGVFPVTGQTLPMISMGGTSMLITGVQLGVLLSVSRSVLEVKKQPTNDLDPTFENEPTEEIYNDGDNTETIID
ncbi:MAG: putative peptidoglycan glycosyltransferase FtsW [Salinivirgaceae bacterium]|nr:putative peptidoglycan glycosyltransferase FtsW [Salinivirgaceae bacterium]MDY0279765.1 putative peptidoglycan glycosyltransferase FtsW [Salinivirgaceae bacterium]